MKQDIENLARVSTFKTTRLEYRETVFYHRVFAWAHVCLLDLSLGNKLASRPREIQKHNTGIDQFPIFKTPR